MLSNLDWLKELEPFPPLSEVERMDRYDRNIDIFENNHLDIYGEQFKRIGRVIGNFEEVVSYPIILNFQKKISLKIADFLFVEHPIVSVNDDEEIVKQYIEDNDLWNKAYEIAIDCSRAGTGLFTMTKDFKVGLSQPQYWFPIVSPFDIKEVKHHVLAWVYQEGVGDTLKDYLMVRIHSIGSYEERKYYMHDGYIGKMLDNPIVVKTGLTDFAVLPIHNLTTSNREHGIDDYEDVDSIVSELEVRISQIAKVLDEHASPSIEGSEASLERDPVTGAWGMKMGKFFIREDKDSPTTQYITWDANLESSFEQIDRLINFLSIISEMGPAIFDDGEKMGAAASGTALSFRFMNVLAKVSRVRGHFDHGLKKLLKMVYGQDAKINIIWQDGLPTDAKEMAEIADIRTAGKATQSQKKALMQLDNISESEAVKQMDEIREDDALNSPMQGLGADNPLDENVDEGEE